MELKFRPLQASEIEVRVNTINEKGLSLLLYKDARCDMKILDEELTPFGWQREHKELKGNIYCGVSIKNENGEWITKWDAGSESYTEKVKGEASDSFKRACFNWGIGRELYTAPFIWINANDCKIDKNDKTNKHYTYDKFFVEQILYENGVIVALSIKSLKTKQRVFTYDGRKK